jgi:tRNA dimethylallyltransferase
MPAEAVRRWCEALDPVRGSLGRAQWERAIEVALFTGRRISTWHEAAARAPALTGRYLLLDPGTRLAGRITARVDEMLAAGWLSEVRALAAVVGPSARAWTATGYGALRRVVDGRQTLSEAREEIIVRTRQYAKRQRTWFRHQLAGERVTRLDPGTPDALDRAVAWYHGEEG